MIRCHSFVRIIFESDLNSDNSEAKKDTIEINLVIRVKIPEKRALAKYNSGTSTIALSALSTDESGFLADEQLSNPGNNVDFGFPRKI